MFSSSERFCCSFFSFNVVAVIVIVFGRRHRCLLVSVSVFMAFSTVLHSINSANNSPLSHFVLLVLIVSCWSLQLYIDTILSLHESLPQP